MPRNLDKPHYQVAAGILAEAGNILVSRRPAGTHLAGCWEFPGGKQEDGETLEACLEREMLEELGLRVTVGQCLATVQHEYPSKQVTLHFFFCSRSGGEPAPLQGQEIRWVKARELRNLPFPPPDMKVIDILTGTFLTGGILNALSEK